MRFDVLGGEDRIACRDAAHERQRALHGNAGNVLQPQAARSAREHFDRTLARKRLQVIFG